MLIICDKRLPETVKNNLAKHGQILEFKTVGTVDETLSGHPDIFIHRVGTKVFHAPNTPPDILTELHSAGYQLVEGVKTVDKDVKSNYAYNVVSGVDFLICNFKHTDESILRDSIGKEIIDVRQGFSACSCINLEGKIITSDHGIHKKIVGSIYFNPSEIILPGLKHGLVGGCAGFFENKIFITGSLNHHADGSKLVNIANENSWEIIELSQGKLFDGGGIMFFE